MPMAIGDRWTANGAATINVPNHTTGSIQNRVRTLSVHQKLRTDLIQLARRESPWKLGVGSWKLTHLPRNAGPPASFSRQTKSTSSAEGSGYSLSVTMNGCV
jgi:hypothetical protein